MKKLLLLHLITFSFAVLAQQPAVNAEMSPAGVCSPNIISNQGPVTITCNTAIDQATAAKVVSLLNRILRDEGASSDEVNKKLDSIMEFLQSTVNPNRPVTTYDCGGNSSTESRGAGVGLSVNTSFGGPTAEAFQRMDSLNSSRQYSELLAACTEQKKSAPEWLTPRLFCGLAHFAMGHMAEAKKELNIYDRRTGPAYESDKRCKSMSDFLHARL